MHNPRPALRSSAPPRYAPSLTRDLIPDHPRRAQPIDPNPPQIHHPPGAMNELAALLLTALYYTFFLPVHTLFRGLALVLSPVYYGLQFVLLPFIYLAHIVWRILVLPFVLLAKLEVYIVLCLLWVPTLC